MCADTSVGVPVPVARRLAHYLHHVRSEQCEGREWLSSHDLANALEVTSSTVRQDLTWVSSNGIAKRGYNVSELTGAILGVLGRDRVSKMVIAGAGHLGQALAQHQEFYRQGFAVCGLYDTDPALVGQTVGRLVVKHIDELPSLVDKMQVDIGIITVPGDEAQEVADLLARSGVKGVLNLSVSHVKSACGIPVVEARITSCLSLLSHAIKSRRNVKSRRKTGRR